MSGVHFEFTPQAPADQLALVWETFFVERGRGLRLEAHFPWLLAPVPGLWQARLREDGALRGCLTVKAHPDAPGSAALGLVCVPADQRGRGWGARLLAEAVAAADAQGIEHLTLWTRKPAVYAPHGFRHADDGAFGTVEWWQPAARQVRPVRMAAWPDAQEAAGPGRGLPAFANHAARISDDDGSAQAVLLWDAQGVALAEWQGNDAEVLALLAAAMPPRWRLNTTAGDTLPLALSQAGAVLSLLPANLEMHRSRAAAQEQHHPPSPAPALYRLLDRV